MPAFSPKKARDFIEKELGAPVDVLFKLFEEQPIAAASLGQVSTLCLLGAVFLLFSFWFSHQIRLTVCHQLKTVSYHLCLLSPTLSFVLHLSDFFLLPLEFK